YGVGDPKTPMKLTLAGLAVELVVLGPAIHFFGVTGAASASVLTSTLLFVSALIVARGPFGTVVAPSTLLRAGLAFVLTVALGLALSNGTFFALLWSPLLAVANLAVLLVTRETSVAELALMLKRSPVAAEPAEVAET
ncbi:MAG TPA: polysaccharide biosynthesis C-terminal domain-containing protein, partial [Polyangiaceae bacterium]|nr:polysaccharide biosynthesis C-terminal domain-containing protein [Polyangiaceae bacterium]